ncbi:ARM repeat-containing protein [Cryphonectria parasitica EP155]|uniref:ARM repeat-containing protein n=1 Tax=Cryphonectria parasitica (strain ATCC 38755 / EP155) TaxID=660469 RepID=A0A9P4YC29_CRYP1|nr:ARM repeat-containing protein [Cryphonectria parasitica EP155]KAF3769920.1 ARM repeat-containing protein [Cryphonectria parasitica EP155]
MAQQVGPHSEFTSSVRNQFFAKLKPICVEISKFALQGQPGPEGARRTQDLLNQLNGILEGQIQYDASALDEKIADYIFFPLSHLLRRHEAQPVRLIETVIKTLRLLIQHGWKARISKDLSQQLLILLTFIIGGVPGRENSQPAKPEETVLEGYRALTALIKTAGVSAKDSPLTDAKIIPSFGHAVSVILDGVTDGSTPEIQLASLLAISAVYTTVKQDEVLATFFPGTVSSLSRLLSPPSSIKAQRRVLFSGTNILKLVLTKVLSDLKIRNLLREQDEKDALVSEEQSQDENAQGTVLTLSWLNATVAQVKIALSTVLKLRNHDGADVRNAVEKLCIALLDECHSSLSNCTAMLVETAMVLREDDNDQSLFYGTSLQDLAIIYPELVDSVNTTVHNWITSMPRMMQSGDEQVKQRAIRSMTKGQELLSALGVDSSSLEESLSSALRDSIVALILTSKDPKVMNEVDVDMDLWRNPSLVRTGGSELQTYQPVLLPHGSQRDIRRDVAALIQNIGSSRQQTKLAAEMLPYLRDSRGVDQIASYWLSFQLLRSSFSKTTEVDDLLDLTDAVADPTSEDQNLVFDELYSFSVSILDAHSDATDETDWRLEATALEVIAFAASRLNRSFRPELIDVLYPVSTFLGSARPELRSHAITTLNNLAASCGYGSVSELIIDNVDYMVNSVSLRLNQFDISPASTKVLTMMIRLTGPKLLPFLDDVVAGIFAALDNYHGYTTFVESLFGVLSEVVEQGVKSDRLITEGGQTGAANHRKRPLQSSGVQDTLTFLHKRTKRVREQEEEGDVEEIIRGHPRTAWKSAKEELDAIETRDHGQDDQPEDAPQDSEEITIPQTPTYTLMTKVTSLTQHYLTSPQPTLRKQLLELLSKVSPALAPDENAFLPLVNDIWPVIISRLHDTEPYVVIAACGTLSALCESAGDFLSTRVKTEWWESLGSWCFRAKDEARKSRGGGATAMAKSKASGHSNDILIPMRGADHSDELQLEVASRSITTSTGLGRFASAAQAWVAVVSMLIAIVSYVRIEDEIFEQILDLLADDVLPRSEQARKALEAVNADAVWLALYERGYLAAPPNKPAMDGVIFTPL